MRALAGCDVTASVLDGPDAAATLAAGLDPAGPVSRSPYPADDAFTGDNMEGNEG